MVGFRILSAILGLAFAGSIIWGFADGRSVVPLLEIMLAEPWGIVTLADLYLGFVLAAGIIIVLEPHRMAGILWGVSVIILGNVITAAWIVFRLPGVLARLRG